MNTESQATSNESSSHPEPNMDDDTIISYETFDDMNLKLPLVRGIYGYGYEKPSLIQQKGIVALTKRRDIVAQSQSGTGKTATFCIGTLQMVDETLLKPQVLIMAPTRELAKQINTVLNNLSDYMKIKSVLCIGGEKLVDNISELEKGCHYVVGTPGRIFDLLKRYILNSENLTTMVLDEADEMLSSGFKEQMYDIFQFLPCNCQVCLFSATIPNDVLELSEKFMRNPLRLLVKSNELTLDGIKQFYIAIERDIWKLNTLCDIYSQLTINQAIIYCNTRKKAEWLCGKLIEKQFTVNCIHGDMTQADRNRMMLEFREGSCRVLVATDIISRGIDIQQVSVVINYDIPKIKETYIHRIGRSGRFGRKGLAINFATNLDIGLIQELCSFYETQIEEMPCDLSQFV